MLDGAAGVLVVRSHHLEDVAGRAYEWLLGELWRGFIWRDLDEAAVRRDMGQARADTFTSLERLFPAAQGMSPMSALRLFVMSVPDEGRDLKMRLVATVAGGFGGSADRRELRSAEAQPARRARGRPTLHGDGRSLFGAGGGGPRNLLRGGHGSWPERLDVRGQGGRLHPRRCPCCGHGLCLTGSAF